MTAPFTVDESAIAGRGWLATVPIPAGTVVARLTEPVGLAELGNHSCDPNLWFDGPVLLARRDIRVGEELTVDYSTLIDDPDWLLRCHCESTRCRQMVAGDDWRIPALQQRYGDHWAPQLLPRLPNRP